MKAEIHPEYQIAHVRCTCGNEFETRSTKELIKLEICAACHPFYTGQQRLVDTAGRVERFKKRFESTQGKMVVRKAQTKVKKIEHVGASAKRQGKVLTTAPQADKKEKGDKKPASPAKKA